MEAITIKFTMAIYDFPHILIGVAIYSCASF
jgi:hypothetical protein